tara:strand:- start:1151 stop:1501 length:351 start_codon:yes stop_codon:yes gene_type:complete
MRELFKMVAEKQEREQSEDLKDHEKQKSDMKKLGYDSDEIDEIDHKTKDFISDEDYNKLIELMKHDTGFHLADQCMDEEGALNEEDYKTAWLDWVQDKLPRRKQKKLKPDLATVLE